MILLNELLSKPYSYTAHEADGKYKASFVTADKSKIELIVTKANNAWVLDFFRNGAASLTGDGDAFRIFATVLRIIDDFIIDCDPEVIVFAGITAEASRISLFNKLTEKVLAKYKSYIRINQSQLKPDDATELDGGFSNAVTPFFIAKKSYIE
jgi:hypothetical protein